MRSFTILFSIFLFLHLSSFTISELNVLFSNCSNDEYYTEGGIYGDNLNKLLDSLSSDSEKGAGFYNLSAGRYPNQVYGIALCRGDVLPLNCTDCIKSSAGEILQICPNQTEAVMYSDDCLLRFSDSDIFGRVYQGETPTYYLWNPDNVSEPQLEGFNQALESLLENLTDVAASGDSTKKYATGSHLSSFIKIYGLLQCTPDLSAQDCENCLVGAISEIPVYGAGRKGGRVVKLSCNLRFENYRFYEITPPPPPPPLSPSPLPVPVEQTPKNLGDLSPPEQGKKSSDTKQTVTIVVVSIIGGVILIICVWLFLRIRKPKRRLEVTSFKEKDNIDDANSLQFNFETIRAATSYFSDRNKIGQGGFGTVYKGTLADGQDIAVKRLSRHSEQGDSEFKNEVMLVAQLQHRNLVRLLGFSIRGTERLLIYEFVPNTSLDHFIFDSMKRSQLDWDRRYRIIKGIVKGLLYLHEDSRLRIVHRDMKASNILLDEEMNPKIADFGMARLFIVDQTQGNTSKIVGTYGYMAPEYAMHGQFSVKSDVYSFGVLVLEIVSGQRNNCFQSKENKMEDLLTYAWKNWKEGTYMNIVDPNLENGLRSEIMRCIHIGLLCVQENVTDRPTMASVLLMLNSNSLSLPIPLQPLFFMHSTIESDHVSLASSM